MFICVYLVLQYLHAEVFFLVLVFFFFLREREREYDCEILQNAIHGYQQTVLEVQFLSRSNDQ